jgi:hypothetical protein
MCRTSSGSSIALAAATELTRTLSLSLMPCSFLELRGVPLASGFGRVDVPLVEALALRGLHNNPREYFVAALERLIDSVGYLHAVLDHISMCLAPKLFGAGLAPGRRIPLIDG